MLHFNVEGALYKHAPGFKDALGFRIRGVEQMMWTSTSVSNKHVVTRWSLSPQNSRSVFRDHVIVAEPNNEILTVLASWGSVRCITD